MLRVKHKQVFHLDEEAIRAAFMAGVRPKDIADRYNFEFYERIIAFIQDNCDRWVAEEPFNRALSDSRRLVRNRIKKGGGACWVTRVSLPHVSMHVAAMLEVPDARPL